MRTAKMPATGDTRRCNRRLAVRNPSSRPSFRPSMTRPLMRKSRPNSTLASSIRPAASASRTRVELTGLPPDIRGGTTSTGHPAPRSAPPPSAEPGPPPAHPAPAPPRAHQDPLDETRTLQARELRIEAQNAQLVAPRRRAARGLVAQPHQPRRRVGRLEVLLRLGLEAD